VTAAPQPLPGAVPEVERRADLARMKARATGLLAAVAAAWVALLALTDGDAGWVGYAVAAAEAGMVGGLADWFAVTAVFRHPLGLPIPHTAVVAARKDQFGVTLGEFVQANFLSADVVGQRVAELAPARRAGTWLARPASAELVAGQLAGLAGRLARHARDEDVVGLVEAEVRRRIDRLEAAPALGRLLRLLTAQGHHEAVLDELLAILDRALADAEPSLRRRFTAEAPWWLPEPVDEVIFQRLMAGVRSILAGAATPGEAGHGLREEVHAAVDRLVTRLEYDPVLAEKAEAVKQELLGNEQVRRWLLSVWGELKQRVQLQAAQPDSVLRARLTAAVVAAGRRLLADEELARQVDELVVRAARTGVEHLHDELAGLVSGTIARWDTEETSDRLELLLGRDLQFIRINGTLVGAAAGVLIHGVARAAG
jgi:uncharacterized membrane-anchored protein YjiN (DUF445 family)